MATRNTAKKYRLSDYKQIRDNFLDELIRASKDQQNSISYFRHNFPTKPIIESISPKAMSESRIVQAFVIGGTNFDISIAQISKDGTIKQIKHTRKKGQIPQLSDAKIFLNFIKQHTHPETKAIAVNFAQSLSPMTGPFGEVDGILQLGSKEHLFEGLVGKPVGESIRKKIKRDIPITVVNDTVCLGENSLVVGTGINLCINNVNLEAGNFNKFPPTDELELLDKQSVNPGHHRYEKIVSGSYLPLHFNLLSKKYNIQASVKNGWEITEFATTDKGQIGKLSRMLMQRSAFLVASALAAAYFFSNKKILTFATEGSLFWKGHNFEKNVTKQLLKLDVPSNAVRFQKIVDSSMQGALSLLTRTQ